MNNMMKILQTMICCTLAVQLAGCGTLLHSDRRGQKGGRIDPAIAVLDGIGLLLFIIPGLIAFAIDFSTGAIYLPGTASLDRHDMKVVTFDPTHTTAADIEEILWKETGQRVQLNQANMEISRLGSLEDMQTRFTEARPSDSHIRVAFNTR